MLRVTRCEFVHNLPCEQVSNRLTELQTENAKLRELCADMHECLEDECERCHEWGDGCDLEYEMRKLGVMG